VDGKSGGTDRRVGVYSIDTNIYLDWWIRRYPGDLFPTFRILVEGPIVDSVSLYIASKRSARRRNTSALERLISRDGVPLRDSGVDMDHHERLPLRSPPASQDPF
jgi:hypothetical protein